MVAPTPPRETADEATAASGPRPEARNRRHRQTREARAALERTEADLAATEAELTDLTGRLSDPRTYADAALVRRLIEDHNPALDRSAALTAERRSPDRRTGDRRGRRGEERSPACRRTGRFTRRPGRVLLATLGPTSRFALAAGVDSLTLVTWRAVIGGLFVLAVALVLARFGQYVARPFGEIPRRERLMNVFAGLTNAALNLTVLVAITRISIGLALLVFYTYPAMVAVVSTLLFKERLDGTRWAALGLSLVGLVLVLVGAGQVGELDPVGVALAFAGGLCQVVYALSAGHGFPSVPAPQAGGVTFAMAAATYLIGALLVGNLDALGAPLDSSAALVPVLWAGTIGAGIPDHGLDHGHPHPRRATGGDHLDPRAGGRGPPRRRPAGRDPDPAPDRGRRVDHRGRHRRPAPARGRARRARGGARWLYPAVVIPRRWLIPLVAAGRADRLLLAGRIGPAPSSSAGVATSQTPEPSPTAEPTPTPEPLLPDNALLPNLVMEPLADWQVEYDDVGRRLLHVTTVFSNYGVGPFELRGTRSSADEPVMMLDQIVYTESGGFQRVPTRVDARYAGDGHDHWHAQQVVTMELSPVLEPGLGHEREQDPLLLLR